MRVERMNGVTFLVVVSHCALANANGLAVFQNLALRVRLYPTDGQEAFFGQIGGCARLVYNTALKICRCGR
jgi:hypothetical protein